ncbi:MAG: glycosyltransferase family 39 protein [candidate division WOR-3 bacterium]|nr:MAG: glycosyltransferase family 39 protein [candidate division WOR-3 bacterium]
MGGSCRMSGWKRYSITIHVIALCAVVLGAGTLASELIFANRSAVARIALMFSPDGHVTEALLQSLGVAQARLRFIAIFSLSCGVLLLIAWYILPNFAKNLRSFLTKIKLVNSIQDVQIGRVLGLVGAVFLIAMLTVSVFSTPLSIDAALRFGGAQEYVANGNILPIDAAGNRIEDRWDEPFVRYIPAILCVVAGGDILCARIFYAIFCALCIIALGYVTKQIFGYRSGGYAIFFASMLPLPFYHLIATDSARTEFVACLFLLIGIFVLYQRSYKSRWVLLLACLMIGISTWLKFTLLLLAPVFLVTGLVSGINKKSRDRVFGITLGPIIGIALVWVLDTVSKVLLFGNAKAVLSHIFSYWFISDIHMTLASTVEVPVYAKLLVIDRLFSWPVFAGVMILMMVVLLKERFRYPLKLFVFLATGTWLAWWVFFDSMGMPRHLIVGILFFCILIGGCCANLFRHFVTEQNERMRNVSNKKRTTITISFVAVLLMLLMVFSIKGLITDTAWFEWAIPMRQGQEQLASYVVESRDRNVFCSWGTTGAYDISLLSGTPLWDISQGMPPRHIRNDRSIQLIVTAWQKHGFELQYNERNDQGLFPEQRKLIESRGRLTMQIGSNDIYEIAE